MSEPNDFPIIEAMQAVMEAVQHISKEGRNTQQNYNFRGIDAVVNAVGPALRDAGVVCVPVESSIVSDERYQTNSGANMRNVNVRIRWRFYGPRGDFIDAMSIGEAADAGDKAVAKASSVAYRIVLLQALCIPTDDPDPDASSHERAPRVEAGPPPVDLPRDWASIEAAVKKADNPDEAWALFQAFGRAASYHLFGKMPGELERDQKLTLVRKAAGACVWLPEHASDDGPFRYYDEDLQRRAWASVMDGVALAIPDYVPPELPVEPDEEADPEVEAIAAEVFGESDSPD